MDKDNRNPKDADTGKAQAGCMWQIRKSEEDSESARDVVKVKMWNEKMQQQITCSTKKQKEFIAILC